MRDFGFLWQNNKLLRQNNKLSYVFQVREFLLALPH